MPAVLTKYAAEARQYILDFSQMPEIVGGDTLASVTSVTATPSGLTVGTGSISGATVLVELSGGTSGTLYSVEAVVATTAGWVLAGVGQLSVQ